MITELIQESVDDVLARAATWLGWDGTPVYRDGNAWTPHKAIRRVADHLLDHLAEIDCRVAGLPTIPDEWHGRTVTTHADFARFTETDLDEARSRLTRLAACYRARLQHIDPQTLDEKPQDGAWSLREVIEHVANVTYYARMLDQAEAS
ncbi:DinB family protein [Asanoa sp. NPDC050611]|uniref:DinB family protein n=1 Tax=Asanoa sp. NPDC050611 TaxID=3157098 RepID=UPI0033E13C16